MIIEPIAIIAGDSAEWGRVVPQHPATDWVGTFVLSNATNIYQVSAQADGEGYRVFLGASTTAAWTSGKYDWVFYLTHQTDQERRTTVATGKITIRPNPASQQLRDGRSHAERMLDLIESALEGKATNQQLDLLRASHNNRDFERNPELLIKWRDTYRAEVRREQQQAALTSGAGFAGARLRVRF